MLNPSFWQDKSNSQKVIKEKKLYEDIINSHDNSIINLKDLDELNKIADDEENMDIQKEVYNSIKDLRELVKKNEIKCFLSNEADSLDCYIEIHAGAGGTESQDWAEMLRRMYLKWSDIKKFRSNLISEHKGDEAGIKSSTIKIEGDYVFGWLKKESGIHRLVRISPFDSGARRHTSFASIWVYPVVDENINIEILDKDLTETNYNVEKNIVKDTENSPPSLLSTDLFIKGNLTTSGDIQIEGEVEGNIKASLLTVGQNAKIKGEINTNELIINGFVSGTIRSKKVTLTSSAKVEGDIIHNTIAIETGAHFEGSIEKTDNPLSKSDLKNGKLIN